MSTMSINAGRGPTTADPSLGVLTSLPHSALTFTSAAISALTYLYRQWRLAGSEIERLSACVDQGHLRSGLASFERACTLIRVTDGLADVVRQQRYLAPWPIVALRVELLAALDDWLAGARRALPPAAMQLCTLAGGPTEEVNSALGALELMSSDLLDSAA